MFFKCKGKILIKFLFVTLKIVIIRESFGMKLIFSLEASFCSIEIIIIERIRKKDKTKYLQIKKNSDALTEIL